MGAEPGQRRTPDVPLKARAAFNQCFNRLSASGLGPPKAAVPHSAKLRHSGSRIRMAGYGASQPYNPTFCKSAFEQPGRRPWPGIGREAVPWRTGGGYESTCAIHFLGSRSGSNSQAEFQGADRRPQQSLPENQESL
jgi:hypothetical protein